MIVIGIDGSTKSTGVTVMNDSKIVEYQLIQSKEKDAYVRIFYMTKEIYKILDKYDVKLIKMEKAFSKQNIDTTMKLANLSGAIMAYCAMHDVRFENPLPSEWRAEIGMKLAEGKHKVKREELKEMAIQAVKDEYDLEVNDDVAESILIARSCFNLPKLEITEDDLWKT